MTNARVVLLCAGDGSRWGNHLGVPKHLIPLEGGTLLERLASQFKEYGPVVVVADTDDTRYETPHSWMTQAKTTPQNGDVEKFLSSTQVWRYGKRDVLLVYGDCYLSDYAVQCMKHWLESPDDDRLPEWVLFGRLEGSSVTGSEWGECFAFGVRANALPAFHASLRELAEYHLATGNRNGGWEQYANLSHGDLSYPNQWTPHFFEIDDFTEDFDYPEDYEKWVAAKRRAEGA